MPSTKTPPPILTSDELYDSIMGRIEPELVTANQELVDELIKYDTSEERKERAARYERAFKTFEEEFKKEQAAWDQSFHAYKQSVLATLHDFSRERDEKSIERISSSIQAA